MSRYLRSSLSVFVVGFFGVVLFNALVDPYGLVGTPATHGWTTPKTEVHYHSRLVRAYEVCGVAPASIALGASDVALAIDPSHPGWSARPVQNVALLGGNIHEMRRYFEHAQARAPLRQVFLSLDVSAFDENLRDRPDFDESRLGVPGMEQRSCSQRFEPFVLLASIDTLYSSAATLVKNFRDRPTWFATEDGMWHLRRESDWTRAHGGPAAIFAEVLEGGIERSLAPPWRDGFKLADAGSDASRMDDLRAIVDAALRDGIDLRIVLGPSHALEAEARRSVGLESEWERWVRMIVDVVSTESAKRPGSRPVPVWNFSGYNSITTDDVPPAGDTSLMRWYVDPAHYRPEVGDLILDEVLGVEAPSRSIPEDFGIRLTRENIERALAENRAAGARYRQSHSRDVAALEAIARKALERRARRGLGPSASQSGSST